MDGEPLRSTEARARIRTILAGGTVLYSKPHALNRLAERHLTTIDCENVLRGGAVAEAEWENGGWRYHVRTARITVVVELLSESELLIVTAWRNPP